MELHIVSEANRCLNCKKPECQQGCPIHTPIPQVIQLFKQGTFPWQWFPKAAELPWREASNGGQRPPWQEESNETGGFVAHDFVRKV